MAYSELSRAPQSSPLPPVMLHKGFNPEDAAVVVRRARQPDYQDFLPDDAATIFADEASAIAHLTPDENKFVFSLARVMRSEDDDIPGLAALTWLTRRPLPIEGYASGSTWQLSTRAYPPYEGNGLSSKFIGDSIKETKVALLDRGELNPDLTIFLTVANRNVRAMNIYKRLGFAVLAPAPGRIGRHVMTLSSKPLEWSGVTGDHKGIL